MPTFTLKTIQRIPTDLEKHGLFFQIRLIFRPLHLRNLGFTILSDPHSEMYPGQIIEYKVRPVLGIPIYWMTEITHVQDRVYFVDEQRFGPYQLWQHQHHFRIIEGGVQMTDIVHYRIPLGFLEIWQTVVVEKQLRSIFEFRFKKIEELFGRWEAKTPPILPIRVK